MRKLKGLWLIGLGLLMLVLWTAFFIYLDYALTYVPPTTPFVTVLMTVLTHSLYVAFAGILSSAGPWNLWPITGFALTFIGLYRLVRSLFPSQGNSKEEE